MTHAVDHPAKRLAIGLLDACAPVLARVLPVYARDRLRVRYFSLWERHGFRVTPVHFYEPIPDTRTLPDALWERESDMVGVDMREEEQLRFLRELQSRYRDEWNAIPREPTPDPARFHFANGFFTGADALLYYAMVRHFRPARIVEVGAGFSSRLAAEALRRNGRGELVCIDPHPDPVLRAGFPELRELITRPVQEAPLALFESLRANDILFVDSSHVVRCGGDVNHLMLEVLPRLAPGVIVHLHDIALPREYSRRWIMERRRFFTEQYLLHAFLMFNEEFEVLLANRWLLERHPALMRAISPDVSELDATSFWMRRRIDRDVPPPARDRGERSFANPRAT